MYLSSHLTFNSLKRIYLMNFHFSLKDFSVSFRGFTRDKPYQFLFNWECFNFAFILKE